MTIRKMTKDDKEVVLSMEKDLNNSPAVDEAAPIEVIRRSFNDATGDNPNLVGYIFEENDNVLGFAYLTFYYSCEVARNVVMIEELFVKDEYRSLGVGTKFFSWLYKKYPKDIRFKLEVTRNNRASNLYKRCGFSFLDHDSMVYDI